MLFLWKMLFNPYFHVQKRRRLIAPKTCMILRFLFLQVDSLVLVLMRQLLSLYRFHVIMQIIPFLMQIYMMHLLSKQKPVSYTPQQNGVLERKNMSLMEMARCMVKSQALPHSFWLEAIMCTTYVLNRCPTKALQSITPCEALHGRKPSVAHLHLFGCLAYALVPKQHRKKLDDKAVKCIFVGYNSKNKVYRLYHP
ncbi:hypothetical protein KP509_19G041700 [Ceratopteris richardii]|uniref:Integrase catalytic domain-containing protein n=1 Tax=Ceratopteris richardii TaxID=49495 RepID=A0A8T2SLU6_CERRI|nr:hypothetical protein KP509_19G041700 [Ceratopteris richardii]